MKKILQYLFAALVALGIGSCLQPTTPPPQPAATENQTPEPRKITPLLQNVQETETTADAAETSKKPKVKENGTYTDKDKVALYIHTYGHLPSNYITKNEAQRLGWDNTAGNLRKVAPGKSIGGDRFGNYEGQLPKAKKRKYYECDIDYGGGRRNAKRIIYSDDGLIFYTDDHYKTFQQLY